MNYSRVMFLIILSASISYNSMADDDGGFKGRIYHHLYIDGRPAIGATYYWYDDSVCYESILPISHASGKHIDTLPDIFVSFLKTHRFVRLDSLGPLEYRNINEGDIEDKPLGSAFRQGFDYISAEVERPNMLATPFCMGVSVKSILIQRDEGRIIRMLIFCKGRSSHPHLCMDILFR